MMKATDPVALLVGNTAYLADGGKIVADLFSEDERTYSDKICTVLWRLPSKSSRVRDRR